MCLHPSSDSQRRDMSHGTGVGSGHRTDAPPPRPGSRRAAGSARTSAAARLRFTLRHSHSALAPRRHASST
eukprot:3086214-Prymnesium_polylepis.1